MQPYPSLDCFVRKHKLLLPAPKHWWLLYEDQARLGQICGLWRFQGRAIATNGIMVAIEGREGVKFGHWRFFVAEKDSTSEPKDRQTQTKKPSLRLEMFTGEV